MATFLLNGRNIIFQSEGYDEKLMFKSWKLASMYYLHLPTTTFICRMKNFVADSDEIKPCLSQLENDKSAV